MPGLQSMPKKGKPCAVAVALILLVGAGHAAPAIASNTLAMCDDVADVRLGIDADELQATIASNNIVTKEVEAVESAAEGDTSSAREGLVPRVEAAQRQVVEETTSQIAEDDDRPAMKARVPGISDDELARYKRQMFRTDI